jgi:BirA family biotin operon repressor/biotin-[acetyl-CoA-carboxylase] ligase
MSAEARFAREMFEARLLTRFMGRTLVLRAELGSTNDAAWDAYAHHGPNGFTVATDAQTKGRGREGRTWYTTPGKGLAMSVLIREDATPRPLAPVPLLAGLALQRALDRFGVKARLKWPNDVMLGRKKLGGVLTERRGSAGQAGIVVGLGVNVLESQADFPDEILDTAISLAMEGHTVDREALAAEFLNALEPLWDELATQGAANALAAWRAGADFWDKPLRVRTPSGTVNGVAKGLDPDGRLMLTLPDGKTFAVTAGDVEPGMVPESPH